MKKEKFTKAQFRRLAMLNEKARRQLIPADYTDGEGNLYFNLGKRPSLGRWPGGYITRKGKSFSENGDSLTLPNFWSAI